MRKGPCVQQVWLRRAAGLLRVPRQRGFSSILPEHQQPVPDQLHHLRERGLRSGDPPLRVRVLPRCRHAAAAVHRHPVLHELSLPGRHVLRPRVYAATHAGAVRQLQDAAPGAVQPGLMSQVRRHPRGLPRAAASGRDLRLLRSDQCPLHVGLRLLLGGLQRDSQQLPVDARVSRVSNEGAGAGLEARSQEIAAVETHDSGGTIRKTSGDMMMGAAQLRYFAEMAPKLPLWEEIQVPQFPAQSKNYLQREPIGVCGQIIPWNFPLMMAVWKIGPALAAGNTLVLKPATDTPCSALELAKIIDQTDLPKGVFNVIHGSGAECGEELCTSPLVDKVALTGSTEDGRRVQQLASGTIKKVTLELGGKSANIILDDADLEMAVDGSLFGCFFHQGQAGESGTRLFVPDKLHDEIVGRLVERTTPLTVGHPMDFR